MGGGERKWAEEVKISRRRLRKIKRTYYKKTEGARKGSRDRK
jgi:hypothetical protein